MADLYSFRKKEIRKSDSTYWKILNEECKKKNKTKEEINKIWNKYKVNKDSFVKSVQLRIPESEDNSY